MVVSVSRGDQIDLADADPELNDLLVGLGWDASDEKGQEIDLDASIFMLGPGNRVRSSADIIFYNQMESECGSITLSQDNRTGVGDGDDEFLNVNLSMIPEDVQKLAIAVSIYEAEEREQNFGMVSASFVRLVNTQTNKEIARYDLREESSTETAFVFGEILRSGENKWSFRALGRGFSGELRFLCDLFGVTVED
ncbi:MAG: TerD family protein [Alphaproteobacteria bacterium]|nr:TerD family protein [Alphaproteobacteria bacterium SS10]